MWYYPEIRCFNCSDYDIKIDAGKKFCQKNWAKTHGLEIGCRYCFLIKCFNQIPKVVNLNFTIISIKGIIGKHLFLAKEKSIKEMK